MGSIAATTCSPVPGVTQRLRQAVPLTVGKEPGRADDERAHRVGMLTRPAQGPIRPPRFVHHEDAAIACQPASQGLRGRRATGSSGRPGHSYTRPVPERADLERRTVELLQRLIRFNTVNPPGNESAVQEFLRDLLEAAGFECELLAAVEGRPNLIARMPGPSDGPTLCLLGHVDTVLADPDQWNVDPWAGSCVKAASGAAVRST